VGGKKRVVASWGLPCTEYAPYSGNRKKNSTWKTGEKTIKAFEVPKDLHHESRRQNHWGFALKGEGIPNGGNDVTKPMVRAYQHKKESESVRGKKRARRSQFVRDLRPGYEDDDLLGDSIKRKSKREYPSRQGGGGGSEQIRALMSFGKIGEGEGTRSKPCNGSE